MAEITCAHPGCSCSVIPARLFCSDSCRRAADLPPALHGCSCRHAQCLGDAGRRLAVEEGVFATAEPGGRRSDDASEVRASRPEP